MNIATAFPSKTLRADEMNDDMTLTIKSVQVETVGQGKDSEEKPVIYFRETDKGLVLNKVNANTISGIYGPETDGWIGQRITLFPTEVEFAGKQVKGIRVRMKRPGQGNNGNGHAAAAIAPPFNSWQEVADYAAFRGVNIDDVKQHQGERGFIGKWNPARDALALKQFIDANCGKVVSDAVDDIPF